MWVLSPRKCFNVNEEVDGVSTRSHKRKCFRLIYCLLLISLITGTLGDMDDDDDDADGGKVKKKSRNRGKPNSQGDSKELKICVRPCWSGGGALTFCFFNCGGPGSMPSTIIPWWPPPRYGSFPYDAGFSFPRDLGDSSVLARGLPENPAQSTVMYNPMLPSNMKAGYVYTPGVGFHKYHAKPVAWNSARRICNEEGGHLLIINSFQEMKVVRRIFVPSNVRGAARKGIAHIGNHDMFEEGSWVTLHSESLIKAGYSEWANPRNPDHRDHCGGMLKNGLLQDTNCKERLPFFCEMPTLQYL